MSHEQMYTRLGAGIVSGDSEEVVAATNESLKQGMLPLEIVQKGLQPGMVEIGDKFRRCEIYLPEMMMAADAFEQAMRVLEPKIATSGQVRERAGRIVIGTVQGDIHNLGKNIVATMLKVSGFEVHDLGVDVPASTFVKKAQEVNADVIAVSALMTTTMGQQKNVMEHLKAAGGRDKFFVIIGGGCTTQGWADEIGANGYGLTAADAVSLAVKATQKEKK